MEKQELYWGVRDLAVRIVRCIRGRLMGHAHTHAALGWDELRW